MMGSVLNTKKVSPFFDCQMVKAFESYCLRFPGTTKRGFIHAAIEYYCSHKIYPSGLDLPDGWEVKGNAPDDSLVLTRESTNQQAKGKYGTVSLEERWAKAVVCVSRLEKKHPRQIVLRAIKSYLIETGFLDNRGIAL